MTESFVWPVDKMEIALPGNGFGESAQLSSRVMGDIRDGDRGWGITSFA